MFNLYAFDALHSNLVHAPTLHLFNCDFKYFHDKQALIQVENNNYVHMATADAKTNSEMFMARVGEDRGARIDIQGSSFKHSKFEKGLISYRQPDVVDFSEEPNFVQFSNQVNRTAANEITDNRNVSQIIIKDSVFENLTFEQTLEVLSNLKEEMTTCAN